MFRESLEKYKDISTQLIPAKCKSPSISTPQIILNSQIYFQIGIQIPEAYSEAKRCQSRQSMRPLEKL
jgi:hypothetical protein